MSQTKKSQSKVSKTWTAKKSKANKRGNFPAHKDCVTVYVKGQGHQSVDIKQLIGKGEREPIQREGEPREVWLDRVAEYRSRYRRDMKTINAVRVKPRTIFDLLVVNGIRAKHPAQAAKDIMNLLAEVMAYKFYDPKFEAMLKL